MKQYKAVNSPVGWITFLIVATVYCMTIEPTASFRDCPEFITIAYKLEVGHPPGAPFFMLTANLFTQFVNDPALVAKMINYISVLISGACILFLFWNITHLVRKLVIADENTIIRGQLIAVMGSGLAGALAYTFSDTFWFSAVEGEVYAYSSMFTAIVFRLILRWEDVADQPHGDRWIILIAHLAGLSIGVHLLNLLYLPAIVLVYYYKKVPNTNGKGSLLALAGSTVLVAAALYGIVPGVIKVGGWFELLFTSSLGMSFNTGVIVYIAPLAIAIIWGTYESYNKKNRTRMNPSFLLTVVMLGIPFHGHGVGAVIIGILVLGALTLYLFYASKLNAKIRMSARTMNTALLCTVMIMVGYFSYALIVIRSVASTPMDQNSPEDIFTPGEYLGREQYGTRPLFYDPAYSSEVVLDVEDSYCVPRQKSADTKYVHKEKTSPDEKDSYVELPGRVEYEYTQNMLFPCMYSSAHAPYYKSWQGITGYDVPYDQCGEMLMVNMPAQWDNIRSFFSYQPNFTYWRHFMWNFAGRQNDIQSSGEIEHDNWITGIPFIDNLMHGDQSFLPQELKDNKGHNVFYYLPLLLGIIGLFWQTWRGQKGIQQSWVVSFPFFMTGITIVFYLNQTPGQPHERDYVYAGSLYAFAIWIGMGVAGTVHLLHRYMREAPTAALTPAVCLLVPIQMANQTWDDHDRSGRYVARDFGQNYLMSLQESDNPIIYTNGDNDIFPLWYNQETEGFRTDARTYNLSYLQADWYIDQMKRPVYNSPALPITWDRIEYMEGQSKYAPIRPDLGKRIDKVYKAVEEEVLNGENPEALNNIRARFGDNPYGLKNILKYWVRTKDGQVVIPIDSIVVKIDKEAARRPGMMIPAALGDFIPDYMYIPLKDEKGNPKRALYKSELMILEMLANVSWERPIYIAITVGTDNQLDMREHFIQEGLTYRFTPFDTEALEATIDSEKMYDNLMNKFKFGGIDKPGIYINENTMRMCYTHRRIFAQLITQLVKEGKKDKALATLECAEKMIPALNVPYDFQNGAFEMTGAYYQLGDTAKADRIIDELANESVEYLTWYLSLDDNHLMMSQREFIMHLSALGMEAKMMEKYKSKLTGNYTPKVNELYNIYIGRMKVHQ